MLMTEVECLTWCLEETSIERLLTDSADILGNLGILFFLEGDQNFELGGLGLSVPAASILSRPWLSGENGCPRFVSGQAPLAGFFFFFLEPRKPMQLGLSLLVSTEAHDCKAGEAGTRQRLFTIQCLFSERKRESCRDRMGLLDPGLASQSRAGCAVVTVLGDKIWD